MSYELKHRTARRISAGRFYPLGATPIAGGVNFALFSQNCAEAYLLLFDGEQGEPTDIICMPQRTRYIWHCFVEGIGAGQRYGFKVRGEFNPGRGLRFNEHKLLTDPYAKALSGEYENRDNLLLAYDALSGEGDCSFDTRVNDDCVPKSIVIDDAFDWQGDVHPDIPFTDLVVYEVHVKGFTAHASSASRHAGSYRGFIDKIPYLKDLGINAVELLPVHEYYVEDFIIQKGLTNYWGYNTIGFFCPERSYAAGSAPGAAVAEFKTMVRELHRAGIEVILDVVYNHTAEGSERGPTLSLRGIDNPTYYLLTGPPDNPGRYYMNYTGCGNTLNLSHPAVLKLVMDSLRYWVEVMHVDGFRFDLASVLGREEGGFRSCASFFDAVSQDPVVSRVKLIAEPWDLGTYQVGNFPVDWAEWNGRFRDTMRRFAKGDGGVMRELGARLTGSADLYGDDGRSAYNSVNFITCHDGFTLGDLVSYNGKHNDANGENGADGSNENNSWNCGPEGPTDDPAVLELRARMARNHLCHLLLACGTPMLLGGDEMLRTQGGNNNAYCQDNDISWFDWGLLDKNRAIHDFTRDLIAFRHAHPILHRQKFFTGTDTDADGTPDITWFGDALDRPPWDNPELRTIAYLLDGSEEQSDQGEYLLLIVLNADFQLHRVVLPAPGDGRSWRRIIDTSLATGRDITTGDGVPIDSPEHYLVNPRSTVVLKAR